VDITTLLVLREHAGHEGGELADSCVEVLGVVHRDAIRLFFIADSLCLPGAENDDRDDEARLSR
jgi:hypothetical protein